MRLHIFLIFITMNLFQFVAVLLVGILTFSAKKSSAASISIASCRRIDAAVRWHSTKHTYFFSGSDTILYNDHHHAEEDEVPVTSLAPDFPTNIDAAVAWFENDRSFYFKGCHGYMVRLSISLSQFHLSPRWRHRPNSIRPS